MCYPANLVRLTTGSCTLKPRLSQSQPPIERLLGHGMSIASLERGHKRTKDVATGTRSSTTSVMSKHVLRDAADMLKAGQRLQEAQQQMRGEAGSDGQLVPAPPEPAGPRRAQGAVWFFRRSLPPTAFKELRGAAGNHFTKEYHAAVRNAFQELDDRQKDEFHRMAAHSRMKAKAARGGVLPLADGAAAQPLQQQANCEQLVCANEPQRQPFKDVRYYIVPREDLSRQQLLLREPCKKCGCHPREHPLLDPVPVNLQLALPVADDAAVAPPTGAYLRLTNPDSESPEKPMHVTVYEQIKNTNTKAALRESFKKWTRTVVTNKNAIPRTVEYERLCGGRTCLSTLPPAFVAHRKWILHTLTDMVKGLRCKMQEVPLQSAMFAIEMRVARRGEPMLAMLLGVALLRAASASAGAQAPTQTFIMHEMHPWPEHEDRV